jgi:hypothetical protein
LPTVEADPDVWDAAKITERWVGSVVGTIRAYWYQKVSDTAGYLDVPDAGGTLPITQIHRQAKEMLEYWDNFIVKYGAHTDPSNIGLNRGSTRRIKKRYTGITGTYPPDRYATRTPYPRA